MDKIKIIKVALSEVSQLQSISKQTFIETFAKHNTADDMVKYLDNSYSIKKLTEELNNPDSEFYFAQLDDKVIGYLKINFGRAQTEIKDKKSIEIERIYVLKDFQGKNVGQVLYNKALNIAQKMHSEYVWLGVWEKNLSAKKFYEKNNFVEFDKHIFKLGNDKQTDIMMRLQLN